MGTHCSSCFEKIGENKPSSNNTPKGDKLNISIDWKFEDSNPEQDKNFEKGFKNIQKRINERSGIITELPFNISQQQRIFLSAWQDATLTKKNVDINKLDLPMDKKMTLEYLFEQSGIGQQHSKGLDDKNRTKEREMAMAPFIIVGVLIFLGIIILVTVIKKSRRKARKRK